MISEKEFKQWLCENTTYTERVVRDMVSRVKRADSMLEFFADDLYFYQLSQMEEYKKMSVSVRSQVKRAVKLYHQFVVSK